MNQTNKGKETDMASLQHKIDFAVIFRVKNANPNGDPLNGNRPRTDYDGFGEVSDVCLKRKIRDRLQENGSPIFVQSDDRRIDEHRSLRARAEAVLGKNLGIDAVKKACAQWFDVRAFGQIFAYKAAGKKPKGKKAAEVKANDDVPDSDTGISIPIRGPVTVQTAITVEPVNVDSMQIVKSVSGEGDGSKRGSDTMGMKHRVKKPITYFFYGAMNPQLAERTGFNDEDAIKIKTVLPKLFENDASSARPEGSMQVLKVFWWKHNCKAGQYSSARVHGSLKPNADGTYSLSGLPGLAVEEIDGF
jgi:CRISPR-associated protein Csd2